MFVYRDDQLKEFDRHLHHFDLYLAFWEKQQWIPACVAKQEKYTFQNFWLATFKNGIKILICKRFLWKFIHEVRNIIIFDWRDNYSGIQQKSTCKAGNAQNCICSNLYLTNYLLNVSLKRKTDNIFIILRRMNTEEKARATAMCWYT